MDIVIFLNKCEIEIENRKKFKSKEKVKGSFLVDFKVLIKSSVCFL